MSAHTPGYYKSMGRYIVPDSCEVFPDFPIAEVHTYETSRESFVEACNLARLLAAAPEMFELLKYAMIHYWAVCDPNKTDEAFADKVNELIQKIEGES